MDSNTSTRTFQPEKTHHRRPETLAEIAGAVRAFVGVIEFAVSFAHLAADADAVADSATDDTDRHDALAASTSHAESRVNACQYAKALFNEALPAISRRGFSTEPFHRILRLLAHNTTVSIGQWDDIAGGLYALRDELDALAWQEAEEEKKAEVEALAAEHAEAARTAAPVNPALRAATPRRGRPPKHDPAKDRGLFDAWERSRVAGVERKVFCRDNNIKLGDFKRLQARVRMRLSRANN